MSKEKPLFSKVLIANRGEIALRINRSLKKMGIKSVAVYSEADTNSLHVEKADEAYFIGSSPASQSYLNIQNIINAVRASGAEAVHPGYGLLSENAHFANKLEQEGIKFIGPNSKAIKLMGDKIEAKKIAIAAGVNTVPGYMGTITDLKQAITIAEEIGFPVIVKAASGGGGRGMRIVKNIEEMQSAIVSARLEAESCFNDDRVFIEKLIEKPRHIEIQVLADKFGNVVCLGERECSIQRYHQKVIEEAPSKFIDEDTRQEMYRQCRELVKNVDYYSAGTVEFIVDEKRNFYFLEMNTRIQVEHCVTELITGIDIVSEMIKIAAGQKLAFTQEDVKLDGWAIECRICAEDPHRGFLPSSGRIIEYQEPPKNKNIRVDSGIGPGSDVPMFYDAMVAKLCVHATTRDLAIAQMSSALGSFVIRGVAHNISFLEAIISHERFQKADINTDFISEEYPDGFIGANLTSEITENFLASAMYIYISEQKRASNISGQINNQINRLATRWIVCIDDINFPVLIKEVEGGLNIRSGRNRIYIRTNWQIGSKLLSCYVNGRFLNVKIEHRPTVYRLTHAGVSVKASVRSNRIAELEYVMPSDVAMVVEETEVISPLTGLIVAIKVKKGDVVKQGDELVILTAMKMENIITAQFAGKIADVLVKEGDQVSTGQVLIEFHS